MPDTLHLVPVIVTYVVLVVLSFPVTGFAAPVTALIVQAAIGGGLLILRSWLGGLCDGELGTGWILRTVLWPSEVYDALWIRDMPVREFMMFPTCA